MNSSNVVCYITEDGNMMRMQRSTVKPVINYTPTPLAHNTSI